METKGENTIEEKVEDLTSVEENAIIPEVIKQEEIPEKIGTISEYKDPVTGRFLPNNRAGGKPKGARHFSTLIRESIQKVAEGDAEPQDILMVKALAKKAKEGDLKALDMVFDRVDGKAEQSITLEADVNHNDGFTAEQKEALLNLI